MSMVATFYPAPNAVGDYCNRPDVYEAAVAKQSEHLPAPFMARLRSTGRTPAAGDVKYVFVTRSGPGPIRQPLSESLISPETGLPVEPGPAHKRMKIGE